MAREMRAIDISNQPEVLRLVEEMQESQEPQLLRRGSEDVAILMPTKSVRRRAPRGKPFTNDDPFWKIVGSGRSGLINVSENKHKYLADAYLHDAEQA